MEFEWDDKKNAVNKEKHGVSFEIAALVFRDEAALIFEDDRNDYDEVREIIIGRVQDKQCLMVVFTERSEDVIRIISARQATRREANLYYGQDHEKEFK